MFSLFGKLLCAIVGSETDPNLKQDVNSNSKLSNDWILVGENKKKRKRPIFTQLSTVSSAFSCQDLPLEQDDLPALFRLSEANTPEATNTQSVPPKQEQAAGGETCRKISAVSILTFLMPEDKGKISRAAKRQKSRENRSMNKMQSKNLERNRRFSTEVFGKGKKIRCSR